MSRSYIEPCSEPYHDSNSMDDELDISPPPSDNEDTSMEIIDNCAMGVKASPGTFQLPSFEEINRTSQYSQARALVGSKGGAIFTDYSHRNLARHVVFEDESRNIPGTVDLSPRIVDQTPGQLKVFSPPRSISPAPSREPSISGEGRWVVLDKEDTVTRPRTSTNTNWQSYSEALPKTDTKPVELLCKWPLQKPDTGICGYIGKKQLVKRHIETTHLKMKPFICEYCSKAFPQKTSLDIHRSSHDGTRPHTCQHGCGEKFKDPARRHRHHVDQHGYVPKQSKKKGTIQAVL